MTSHRWPLLIQPDLVRLLCRTHLPQSAHPRRQHRHEVGHLVGARPSALQSRVVGAGLSRRGLTVRWMAVPADTGPGRDATAKLRTGTRSTPGPAARVVTAIATVPSHAPTCHTGPRPPGRTSRTRSRVRASTAWTSSGSPVSSAREAFIARMTVITGRSSKSNNRSRARASPRRADRETLRPPGNLQPSVARPVNSAAAGAASCQVRRLATCSSRIRHHQAWPRRR